MRKILHLLNESQRIFISVRKTGARKRQNLVSTLDIRMTRQGAASSSAFVHIDVLEADVGLGLGSYRISGTFYRETHPL